MPILDKAHRWNHQPFLVNLTRHADAARRPAANIDVVRDIGHVAKDAPVIKHRRDQRNVVEVHPQVGIVDQQPIAWRQIVGAIGVDSMRHDVRQRPQVRRLCKGLRHGA